MNKHFIQQSQLNKSLFSKLCQWCLIFSLLAILCSTQIYAQQVHVGIISAVKHKVEELKDKKDANSVKIISIDSTTVTASVGPLGGTVSTLNGCAKLTIAAGELSERVRVTISLQNSQNEFEESPSYSYYIEDEKAESGVRSPRESILKAESTRIVDGVVSVSYTDYSLSGLEESDMRITYPTSGYNQDHKLVKVKGVLPKSTIDPNNTIYNRWISAPVLLFTYSKNSFSYANYVETTAALGVYNGIPIYSNFNHNNVDDNGLIDAYNTLKAGNTHKEPPITGIETGQEWECVEYVRRYYWLIYGIDISIADDNATNFWDSAAKDSEKTNNRKLIQFKNPNKDTNGTPREGDIIVYKGKTDSTLGHVSIVREVAVSSIIVIQQNWFINRNDERTFLNYNKEENKLTTNPGSVWEVTGWLRSPTPPIKHSPTITLLTAEPASVSTGTISIITCTATGDTLAYNWSAASGTRTGTGSQVTWTAPSLS